MAWFLGFGSSSEQQVPFGDDKLERQVQVQVQRQVQVQPQVLRLRAARFAQDDILWEGSGLVAPAVDG